MTLFLGIAGALSLAIILTGFFVDRAAIKGRVNGGNGLPILVAVIVSFVLSLAVAGVAGIFGGWQPMGWILLLTVPYHVGMIAVLARRLQALATQVAEADRKSREAWPKRSS
jgi:ABC-type multidrug transport system fused ATPase/permease subunit